MLSSPAVPLAIVVALMSAGLSLEPVSNPAFPTHGGTFGGTLLDVDADGDLDIFLSRHSPDPLTFLNRGDLRFELCAATETPALRDHHASSAMDFDGDGHPDIYLTVGARGGKGEGTNGLWTSDGACRYRNLASPDNFLADPHGRGRGALWLDADGDAAPELLVFNFKSPARYFAYIGAWDDRTDQVLPYVTAAGDREAAHLVVTSACAGDLDGEPGMEVMVAGPQGYLLRYRDGLRDITRQSGLGGRQNGVVHPAMADVDNDGDLDLLLGRHNAVEVYFNDGGWPLRPGPVLSFPANSGQLVGLQVADLDNDGQLDLVVSRRASKSDAANLIALGNGRGEFVQTPSALVAGGSPSTCMWAVDLDADGDLDTVSIQGFGAGGTGPIVDIHRNLVAARGVTLVLDDGPVAMGTRVTLWVGDRAQTAWIACVANPLNAAVLPVHFGLGTAEGPFRVTVQPPGGAAWAAEVPRAGGAYRLSRHREAVRIPSKSK